MQLINKQQAIQTLEILMEPHYKVVDAFLAKYPTPTDDPEAWKMACDTNVIGSVRAIKEYKQAYQNLVDRSA